MRTEQYISLKLYQQQVRTVDIVFFSVLRVTPGSRVKLAGRKSALNPLPPPPPHPGGLFY